MRFHEPGRFRREASPRRQHWFLNEKSAFPFRTPALSSATRGVALHVRTKVPARHSFVLARVAYSA
jgi:hypothetical protein